jgi:hypothetical protein
MQSMDFSEYKAKVNNKIVQWRTYGSVWVEPISELECLSASTAGALARFQHLSDALLRAVARNVSVEELGSGTESDNGVTDSPEG